MKATFYPADITKNGIDNLRVAKNRITIQLRNYNNNGNYALNSTDKGNATIHFKGIDLNKAYEIIKNALCKSPELNEYIELELN